MKTYDDCKKQVAEKHGFRDWNRLIIFSEGLPDLYYAEAAEMYAKSKANEAVNDIKLKLISAGLYELDGAGYFPATQLIEELPLPYPDEQ